MRTAVFALIAAAPLLLAAQEQTTREYYPDGQLRSIHIAQGTDVSFTVYHENGKVSETGAFRDGKPNGRWMQFDEQGGRICRVKFNGGVRTGTWILRSTDGLTTHRLHYRDNKLTHGEELDPNGNLVATRDER